MLRSSRRTAGTVEQAAMPVTSMPASSPRNVSANSSAVLRASVLIRHEWRSVSPSKTPRTVLVLPMSIASSIYDIQADVEDGGRVGERADGEVVDPGLGDLARVGPGTAARTPRASRRPRANSTTSRICGGRHVVEQDEVGAGVDHLAGLLDGVDLDLDRQARVGGADELERRHHAAGRDDVVVLDQRRVRQRHPVVDARRRSAPRTSPARAARASSCGCRGCARRCPRPRRPSAG